MIMRDTQLSKFGDTPPYYEMPESYLSLKPPVSTTQMTAASASGQTEPGFFDTLLGAFKGRLVDIIRGTNPAPAQAYVPPQSSVPGWILPVALLGGAGLIAVLVLKRS